MTKKLLILLCVILSMTLCGVAAQPAPFKVMTQNMDAGTDLNLAIAGLMGAIPGGVELTYQEILTGGIKERAEALAGEVAAQKPELLALQEVTLWRTGDTTATATNVLYDQLQLVLAALSAKGTPYDVVAVSTVNDMALPKDIGVLRFTDRDALLIRSDLRPPAFHLSDIHSNIFDAVYSPSFLQVPIQIPAGWISCMVHTGNRQFRLLVTHLESPVSVDPTAAQVQLAQAQQLLHEVRNSAIPVVIAGDFNSDAILGTQGSGPDNTGSAALIQAGGFTDTWHLLHPADPGATWPYYAEDGFGPPFYGPAVAYERIDLIFSKGLNVDKVERVNGAVTTVPNVPFASDHAGLVASFHF